MNAVTEAQMIELLHHRYSATVGNGRRYACAEHVRNSAGFSATRCADFIAMDLWPSSGLALHGHEVKVSRSDWLRELADPGKALSFHRFMHRWWLVVPDRAIVRDDLPALWGLLVTRGDRLRVAIPAPRLTPQPMPPTLLAPLLRATAATAERRIEARWAQRWAPKPGHDG